MKSDEQEDHRNVEDEPSGAEAGDAKYERPVLSRLGTLRELTGGAGPGNSDSAFSGTLPPTS